MATDQPDPAAAADPATAGAPETDEAAEASGAGDGASESEVKRRFREALAKKNEKQHPHAEGTEGESKVHNTPEVASTKRQFRRKSAP